MSLIILRSETEIKLLNVARASLKELQADYEDYLRARKMTIWDENPAGKPTVKRRSTDGQSQGQYSVGLPKLH